EDLEAWGDELHYRSATASTGPQTILKGSAMHATKDGHKIVARELHLIGADKYGNGQQAFARGPGRIDVYDKSNPNNLYPNRAEWRDSLIIVRENNGDIVQDLITLTGDASFVDEEHKQELRGQRIQVWLESDRPGSARAVRATSAPKQQVRNIE